MINRSDDFRDQIIKIVTGFGLGLLFLILTLQVLFPQFQIPFISIIPAGMGLVDFVIHETGHIIFGNLGQFIGILGGTIAQLSIPTVCLLLTLKRRQWINFSIFLFWLGQSLVQISQYVGDASMQKLKLFSPGVVFGGPEPIHDWHYLLRVTGLLWADQIFAALILLGGICFMLSATGIHFFRGARGELKNPFTI